MGASQWTKEAAAESKNPCGATSAVNVRSIITGKLDQLADALSEMGANPGQGAGETQYGTQAAEWVGHASEFVREFDLAQAGARIREQIRERPGRSLLIAAAAGLIAGTFLRRR